MISSVEITMAFPNKYSHKLIPAYLIKFLKTMMLCMQASFDELYIKWLCHIEEDAPPDVHLTLLGNKCDLKKEEDEGVDYLKAKVLKHMPHTACIGTVYCHDCI